MNKFEIGDEVIITDMSGHVLQECLGKSVRIMDVPSCDKYYTVCCDYVLLRLKENQIEAKGMSEFKVGDKVKNIVTNGLAKVLFVTNNNILVKYIRDGGKEDKCFGLEVLVSKDNLKNFILANDEWEEHQTDVREHTVSLLKDFIKDLDGKEAEIFVCKYTTVRDEGVFGVDFSFIVEGTYK